jgi:hypothetical protein
MADSLGSTASIQAQPAMSFYVVQHALEGGGVVVGTKVDLEFEVEAVKAK